jgi:hypothetical protein
MPSADSASDSDSGSLFGSPSPSPAPAPTLTGGILVDPANVGPTALVGAHTHAEPRPRAPAAVPGAPPLIFAPAPRASAAPAPAPSRSGAPGKRAPKHSPPRTQTRARRLKTPPPIALPSPSSQIPAHFLRSQDALLGHAGMIGAVRPSQLPLPQPRAAGLRREHPIVVDPEPAPPAPAPASAPGPSQAQVLQALVEDKEAVSTLAEILRLAAENKRAPPPPPPDARPMKRRRLARADVDWDARRAANQARLQRLVGRLVVLIQDAARRATRDLAMQCTGHYRPAAAYGLGRGRDAEPEPELPADELPPMDEAPLAAGFGAAPDDFMASLEAFMGGMPDIFADPATATAADCDPFAAFPGASAQPGAPAPSATGALDLAALDQLLGMLQALPDAAPAPPPEPAIDPALLAYDAAMAAAAASAPPLHIPSVSGTPGTALSPLTSAGSLPDPATPHWADAFPEPTIFGPPNLRMCPLQNAHGTLAHGHAHTASSSFDPLALDAMPVDMSCLPVDMPADLFVPVPPAYALPMDVDVPGLDVFGAAVPSTLGPLSLDGFSLDVPMPDAYTLPPAVPLPGVDVAHLSANLAPDTRAGLPAISGPAAPKPAPTRPPRKPRGAVVARARERRKLLAAELERAQIELWEATVEGGALTHLLKAGL